MTTPESSENRETVGSGTADTSAARASELPTMLRSLWQGIENLRGYTHNLTDGCDPQALRGEFFNAHIDACLGELREAIKEAETNG